MEFERLNNIMFNTKFISKFNIKNNNFFDNKLSKNSKNNINDKKNDNKIPQNNGIISIENDDTGFWAFYIMKYGIELYNQNKKKFFTVEKEIKIETIEKIKKNPQYLKNIKLKPQEIELNLLNDKRTTIQSLVALFIYNDLNLMLIKNKTFYEAKINDEPINDVIIYSDNVFSLNLDCDITKYNDYYKIHNICKPINSSSFYKLNELEVISKKLEINLYGNVKKKTKQELYNEILTKL